MRQLVFILLLGVIGAAPVFGAEPAGPARPLDLSPVIIALVPALLVVAKRWLPPKVMTFLPYLMPVVGVLVDWGISYFSGKASDPAYGAIYGAMGVGLRVGFNELRKSSLTPDSWTPKENSPVPPPAPPAPNSTNPNA